MIGDNLWVYLSQSPLLWLTVTLLAYMVGDGIYRWSGKAAWANPLLTSIVIVIGILLATGVTYDTYFEGAQFVHFLLGPVTVALAASPPSSPRSGWRWRSVPTGRRSCRWRRSRSPRRSPWAWPTRSAACRP